MEKGRTENLDVEAVENINVDVAEIIDVDVVDNTNVGVAENIDVDVAENEGKVEEGCDSFGSVASDHSDPIRRLRTVHFSHGRPLDSAWLYAALHRTPELCKMPEYCLCAVLHVIA
jgi:hypothetical protein